MKKAILTKISEFLRKQGAVTADVAADIVEAIRDGLNPTQLSFFSGDFPSWEIKEEEKAYRAYPIAYPAYCQVSISENSATVEFSTVSQHGFSMEVSGSGRASFICDQFASERFWADNLQGWVASQYRGNKLAAEWQGRKYRRPSHWEQEEAAKAKREEARQAQKAADEARKAAKEAFDEERRNTPGTRAWRRHHRHCA